MNRFKVGDIFTVMVNPANTLAKFVGTKCTVTAVRGNEFIKFTCEEFPRPHNSRDNDYQWSAWEEQFDEFIPYEIVESPLYKAMNEA